MYGYNIAKHPVLDQKMICLWSEEGHYRKSEFRILPEFGSIVSSFTVDGIEYLHAAPMDVIGKKFFGIPILYPFPNRVRDCRFTFDGVEYQLPDNDGGRSLHCFVSDTPFKAQTPVVTDDSIAIKTTLDLIPGHPLYKLFPIANRLELTYTLSVNTLKLDVKITNLDAEKRFSFGFGIHPYFNVHGSKNNVLIQVPAKKWMEAENLLPTGKLIDMDQSPADLSQPQPLSSLNLDDVWFGMEPQKPQSITYNDLRKKVILTASEIFTHSVTYTAPTEAFFCLENQTNSTDTHNLYAKGLTEAAHLLILNPGESICGSIEIKVKDL